MASVRTVGRRVDRVSARSPSCASSARAWTLTRCAAGPSCPRTSRRPATPRRCLASGAGQRPCTMLRFRAGPDRQARGVYYKRKPDRQDGRLCTGTWAWGGRSGRRRAAASTSTWATTTAAARATPTSRAAAATSPTSATPAARTLTRPPAFPSILAMAGAILCRGSMRGNTSAHITSATQPLLAVSPPTTGRTPGRRPSVAAHRKAAPPPRTSRSTAQARAISSATGLWGSLSVLARTRRRTSSTSPSRTSTAPTPLVSGATTRALPARPPSAV